MVEIRCRFADRQPGPEFNHAEAGLVEPERVFRELLDHDTAIDEVQTATAVLLGDAHRPKAEFFGLLSEAHALVFGQFDWLWLDVVGHVLVFRFEFVVPLDTVLHVVE